MALTGEVAFLLITASALGIVLVSSIIGREWLHITVVLLIVITTFTAGKFINVFGYSASVASPLYAGIFLATDALHELYGKRDARIAIWKGFFALVCLTFIGQLILASPTAADNAFAVALVAILSFIPKLFVGSAIGYIISQNIDVIIYGKLKDAFKGEHLWLRNNISTIISQFIDSVIVYTIAFYGSVPSLWEIILVAWGMKVFVALADTPFLYLIKAASAKTARESV